VGFVAKQELAGDGIHYEPRWFRPWPEHTHHTYSRNGSSWPLGDLIFEIDGVRIGFEICEDAWNGIRPAQRHYLHNVDLILNPSASHFAFGKTRIREGIVCEASRAFSCAYVYSNLLGNEAGRVIYDGEILIAQSGRLLARNRRFSFAEVEVRSAVVDVEVPRRAKKKTFSFQAVPPPHLVRLAGQLPRVPFQEPAAEAIGPDLDKMQEFYAAECLALFDYLRKSASRGFVVSLSGGADSSACAVLAARCLIEAEAALGSEGLRQRLRYWPLDPDRPLIGQALTCVYQATENSSDATETSARELAQALGADWHRWTVQPQLDQYTQMVEAGIGRTLDWATDDLTLQNIQSRVRAPGAWMLANLRGALLLTTSNRSEAAVGYATMDGDTAGGLAPLGGIDKATLLDWLRWAEVELPVPALRYVNALTPSAELRPQEQAQTDEDDLMPYPMLAQIERCAIRDYQSPVEVFLTLRGQADDATLKRYIRTFFTLWARNQWKRERYAPSFHLDDKNLDPRTWCRFPILNSGYRQAVSYTHLTLPTKA
jgi:NAD+ synthase (glutamine-hydrolysing)